MKIFPQIRAIPVGTVFEPNYIVNTIGTSRGEPALVYVIRNRGVGKPSTKRICESEWELAYQQLLGPGQFTLDWFKENMPYAAKDGQCSFRVTGEAFAWLGLARRMPDKRGSKFILIPPLPTSP